MRRLVWLCAWFWSFLAAFVVEWAERVCGDCPSVVEGACGELLAGFFGAADDSVVTSWLCALERPAGAV